MLLNVKEITVHYGKAEALKGVSLEVPEDYIATVIGSNGAGKSTLMATVVGLRKPSSGEIYFHGERIDGQAPEEIVKLGIALVPEGRRVFPFMTVVENLEMGAYTQKNRSQVTTMMEDIFCHFPVLRERRRQLAGTLSGGEQQMLAIARALLSKPKMLLLDEPSHGLSPIMVQEVGKIIKDIHKMGVSILLIEQNARLALGLAQLGYVLETGSIVLKADAKELLENDFVKRAYLGI
jgi:branched-chain amino acid transport system ATP-binding protein